MQMIIENPMVINERAAEIRKYAIANHDVLNVRKKLRKEFFKFVK